MAAWRKIGIVSSIPAAGTKPGQGAAADAFTAEVGNVLEITGTVSNGPAAGTLTLLRWCLPTSGNTTTISALGEWRPWGQDRPIQVGASDDFVDGKYEHPEDDTNWWLLLGSEASYTTDIAADAQCVHYRGRK